MAEYVKGLFTNLYYCFVEDTSLDNGVLPDGSGNIVVNDNHINEEGDWDTIDPQIIQRRLEERRKVEEADHELTDELFNEKHVSQKLETLSKSKQKPVKKLKINVKLINKSHVRNEEIIRNAKKEWERRKEVFGEAEIDEIDEMSDDMHEKHGNNA